MSPRAAKGAASLADRVERAAQAWELTSRQVQVLHGLARGRTNKDIGKELGCTESTVEAHVTQVLRKAGVPRRAALLVKLWGGGPLA